MDEERTDEAATPEERTRPRFPDYRFTLANERTYLAYVRTALALDAAGLAVAQFIRQPQIKALSLGLSVVLTVLGLVVAVLGFARWRSAEGAVHRDEPLPPLRIPVLVSAGLVVAGLAALVIVVLG
ncbi:MAG: YidH family protein [Actinoallomurus sp.]